jgi:hypothetical protein
MTTNAADVEAVAHQLLNGEFDIGLLDKVVGAAYDPISPHRAQANKALMQLQESPDLWQRADGIIEQSQNPNSRFFGLQVLDDAIKTRYVCRKSKLKSSYKELPKGLLRHHKTALAASISVWRTLADSGVPP